MIKINIKENRLFIDYIASFPRVCFKLAKGSPYYEVENIEETPLNYRPQYVKEAVKIALEIYDCCHFSSDITLVYENVFWDEEVLAPKAFVESYIVYSSSNIHSFQYKEDDEVYKVNRYSWKVTAINLEKLFEGIVLSDIGGEKCCNLAGKIFLIDNKTQSTYFLYDDRGVDVYAKDTALLKQLFHSCKKQLLQEELEEMKTMING